MSGPSKPAPAGGGAAMSLYANLLDPKAADPASAPRPAGEKGAGGGAAVKKPMLDPATLRLQPMRRPQPAQKLKPKTSVVFPKAAPPVAAAPAAATSSSSSTTTAAPGAPPTAAPPAAPDANAPAAAAEPPARSSLADWAATEEDEYMYGTGDKRQRGGRKAKKNKNRDGGSGLETNWDDLYDPSRPTNIEEYLRSDERIAEIREWKAVLNAHRVRRQRRGRSSPASSDADEETSRGNAAAQQSSQFAPPPSYSFAPPPPSPPRRNVSQEAEHDTIRPSASSAPPPPDDATGDDAYARRMALSTGGAQAPRSASPALAAASAPSNPAAATISRAPVRYDTAAAPDDEMDVDQGGGHDGGDDDDGDQPTAGLGAGDQQQRSSRPGKSGFAARMMEKMGWEKGRGLGAEGNEGITKGLSVKLEKRRRLPDAEGGGFAQPGGVARIVGGKPAPGGSGAGQEGRFGRMSEVVVLRGMLEGMHDVAAEVEKGLSQEIGEECGEKYGRLERVYIHVETKQVFIKFTDQVSALRAVNALQGRVFNGNAIVPAFYDAEKFEAGVYQ
ncbi:hypothetical protein GGTG_02719 [Gaeumannomyces tritici R3-111a-1]|uniref:G-patch domain-containing protein n=1 Tax=Gaeumannomyces tritici (strain R3-111a-1) TaxID=644352 RepID=J3NN61_GAET3|nr:hypothetical protein GGTG_02719 [Gaeumannomyces tritici R3-111a-1]EJT77613.1 hypothetical protein GGTG_02719 [Gaeumannomyces tritici R3-111a-1]